MTSVRDVLFGSTYFLRRARYTLASILFGALLPAHAWGPQGHQTVGAIADQMIAGTPAQKEVKRILGSLTLQQVSVWADCAKGVSGSSFTYQNNDTLYPECKVFANEKSLFESYVKDNWDQCGAPKGNQHCHQQYHFADVSTLHDAYGAFAGTSDHDVVHAIKAAIAKLQHPKDPAPSPFNFDEREALMLLSHFVGDIHQPLHVESIYLDSDGEVVDPDQVGDHVGNETAGGNLLKEGQTKRSLHSDWDQIPATMKVHGTKWEEMLGMAAKAPPTTGPVPDWSAAWASDTIEVGKGAYKGLQYTVVPDSSPGSADHEHNWTVTGIDRDYRSAESKIKEQQLTKAGARLAEVLEAIWPK